MKKAVVLGGNGFIGPYIIRRLAAANYKVVVVSHSNSKKDSLKLSGNPGQISFLRGSVEDRSFLDFSLKGADLVINLVGTFDKKKMNDINHIASGLVAELCTLNSVKKLIYFSTLLNCDGKTAYGATKLAGERAVFKFFPNAVVLRPSAVFGEEDHFINLFTQIGKNFRIVPVLYNGNTLLQPVYVADVAKLVMKIALDESIERKTYNVAGPSQYTIRELISLISKILDIRIFIVSLPYWVMYFTARILECSLLSPINKFISGNTTPLFTRQHVKMLKYNSISITGNTFDAFGIPMLSIEDILPTYLKSI